MLLELNLTQLRKMQQGMYFYNNGNFKLIKNIKTKDLNAILKTEKVVIKDKGTAFNPLEKEDPDLGASVSERKIGGLGIYIVKNQIV